MRVQLSLLLSALVASSLALHACAQGALERLQAEAGKMRWNNLERIYQSLPSQDKANPQALYLAGYGLMRLHKPQSAKPLLQQAITSGFHGWPRWTTAEQFLKDIDELQGLTPPYLVDIPTGAGAKLKVFGRTTQWTNVVLQAMPNYVSRAAEAFGADCPPSTSISSRTEQNTSDSSNSCSAKKLREVGRMEPAIQTWWFFAN